MLEMIPSYLLKIITDDYKFQIARGSKMFVQTFPIVQDERFHYSRIYLQISNYKVSKTFLRNSDKIKRQQSNFGSMRSWNVLVVLVGQYAI